MLSVPEVVAYGSPLGEWEDEENATEILPGVEIERLDFTDRTEAITMCKQRCMQLGLAGFSIEGCTARLKPWCAITAPRIRSYGTFLFVRKVDAPQKLDSLPALLPPSHEAAPTPNPAKAPARKLPTPKRRVLLSPKVEV